MATSQIAAILDTLRAALVDVTALAGVNIFSAPVTLEESGTECVEFGDPNLTEEVAAMGGSREETWKVEHCNVWVVQPWQGTTETTIKAARDRALVIFAAVETHINYTYTGGYPDVEITGGELLQRPGNDGRGCYLGFNLTIKNQKNP